MSPNGTPTLFRITRKYKRLLAFFIDSATWSFHFNLSATVTPKILALQGLEGVFLHHSEIQFYVLFPMRKEVDNPVGNTARSVQGGNPTDK